MMVRKTKKMLQCPQTLFPLEDGAWERDYSAGEEWVNKLIPHSLQFFF